MLGFHLHFVTYASTHLYDFQEQSQLATVLQSIQRSIALEIDSHVLHQHRLPPVMGQMAILSRLRDGICVKKKSRFRSLLPTKILSKLLHLSTTLQKKITLQSWKTQQRTQLTKPKWNWGKQYHYFIFFHVFCCFLLSTAKIIPTPPHISTPFIPFCLNHE